MVTQEDFYNENNLITSKLQLVDLAVSERQTHVTPVGMTQ